MKIKTAIIIGILTLVMLIPTANATGPGANWTEATKHAGWVPRTYSEASTVFDNKIWYMGGMDFNGSMLNDVWYSPDGVNWTEATAHANWSARVGFQLVVLDNKMWVIGGHDIANSLNDVWYSSDGTNWIEATAHAGWIARFSYKATIFDNKMWIMGGYNDSLVWFNDVWYSSDGINWTEATAHAGWAPRSDCALMVFNNKMWVTGGGNLTEFFNDTWFSSDGAIWTEATAHANWSARSGHASAVFDNKLWVMGGYGVDMNNVWYSTNGINWIEATAHANWSNRFDFVSVVFENKMYVIGGYNYSGDYLNDVWYSGIPTINYAPTISNPLPANNSKVKKNFVFEITVNDPNGDMITWSIEANNGQNASGTSLNGTHTLSLINTRKNTKIWVNASDGIDTVSKYYIYTIGKTNFGNTVRNDSVNTTTPVSLTGVQNNQNYAIGIMLLGIGIFVLGYIFVIRPRSGRKHR
jgi:hypothetical protein